MLYWPTYALAFILVKLLYRVSASGKERVPKTGPVILTANHSSYLDPIFVGVASPRRGRYMAKVEVMRIPVVGQFFRVLGAFPVRRGEPDRQALKTALEVLRGGGLLVLFPEGKRAKEGDKGAFRRGAGFFAVETGAPIVPMAIIDSDKIWPRGAKVPRFPKVRVFIGNPITLDETGVNRDAPGWKKQASKILVEKMGAEMSRLLTGGLR